MMCQGVLCSLRQLLEEGFFHADPHPGSIPTPPLSMPLSPCVPPHPLIPSSPHGWLRVLSGNLVVTREGQLAYFDFGMMSEMKRDSRIGLIRTVSHTLPPSLPTRQQR